MTKRRWKKVVSVLLTLILFVGVASQEMQAEASVSYMKKLGVKFGIKEGKEYPFTIVHTDGTKSRVTYKISDIELKNATREGYKQLKFTMTYKSDFTPSPEQVDSIGDATPRKWPYRSGFAYWAILDGTTGRTYVSQSGFPLKGTIFGHGIDNRIAIETVATNEESLYYKGQRYGGIPVIKMLEQKTTITYAEDFKGFENLCIGFGGNNSKDSFYNETDEKFWHAQEKFGKTTYYKGGKKNSRWLAVSNIKNIKKKK